MDLANLDIEFLLDKSGSMSTEDCPGKKSRWAYGRECAENLARWADKHDDDGITVVPFAGNYTIYDNVNEAKLEEVYAQNSPNGSTNTAAVLQNRLDAYFARKAKNPSEAKHLCLIVLTDGAPNDQDSVARVISDATKKISSDEEIGIEFIQIGNDPEASKFLDFLDNGLTGHGAKFDIVNTTKIADTENFSVEQLIERAFTA